MRGRLLVLLWLGWSWTAVAAEVPGSATAVSHFEVTSATDIAFAINGTPVGVWSGGALVLVDHPRSEAPVIHAYDKTGSLISQFTFRIPEARLLNIYAGLFARGLDGSTAVAGSAYTSDSRGTAFVAWVAPDGRQQTVIRVSPFAPQALAVAADGALWVAGREIPDGTGKAADHYVIRRFDKSGKLLGSLMPRSSLKTDSEHWHPADKSQLVASKDRIGWYSPLSHTYIEFSPDGTVLDKATTVALRPGQRLNGLALCGEGSLFAGVESFGSTGGVEAWEIFNLDRASGNWRPIPVPLRVSALYGCDDTLLAAGTHVPAITWMAAMR